MTVPNTNPQKMSDEIRRRFENWHAGHDTGDIFRLSTNGGRTVILWSDAPQVYFVPENLVGKPRGKKPVEPIPYGGLREVPPPHPDVANIAVG